LAGVVVRSPRGAARVKSALPGTPVVSGRRPLPPAAVLLAVPDDALAGCAAGLASRLDPGCRVALHVSGFHPAAVLAPLAAPGRALGSIHPLASFPSAAGPLVPLGGVLATVEGDDAAVRAARALARALGMRARTITAEAKPRYHAAAALAANLTYVLVAAARAELAACGFSPRDTAAALRPLVTGALTAALAARGWESLTGPMARGDASVTAAHLSALTPDVAAAYRSVARLAVARLREAGILSQHDSKRLVSALTGLAFSASVQAMARRGSH